MANGDGHFPSGFQLLRLGHQSDIQSWSVVREEWLVLGRAYSNYSSSEDAALISSSLSTVECGELASAVGVRDYIGRLEQCLSSLGESLSQKPGPHDMPPDASLVVLSRANGFGFVIGRARVWFASEAGVRLIAEDRIGEVNDVTGGIGARGSLGGVEFTIPVGGIVVCAFSNPLLDLDLELESAFQPTVRSVLSAVVSSAESRGVPDVIASAYEVKASS